MLESTNLEASASEEVMLQLLLLQMSGCVSEATRSIQGAAWLVLQLEPPMRAQASVDLDQTDVEAEKRPV